MALRYMDSFDHYNTSQMTRKWTVSNPGLNSIDVSSSAPRFGGSGLRVTIGSSGLGFVSKTLDYQSTWVVACAFRYDGGLAVGGHRPILGVCDNTQSQCEVHLRADGLLAVYRGGDVLTPPVLLATGATPLLEGVFYFVEFKTTIHSSAGTYAVRVNGVTDISGSGADTNFTANNSANGVFLGATLASVGTASGSVHHDYDDLHVMDGTGGSPYDDFLGDARVEALLPSGAGSNAAWTASAGSNYQCADDNPANDDTDYVYSSTAGQRDSYAMSNLSSPAVAVYGVMTCMTAKKSDAGARTFAPVIKSGSTTWDGATVALTESYAVYTEVRTTDPDTSSAWTESGVNAMEAGAKCVA